MLHALAGGKRKSFDEMGETIVWCLLKENSKMDIHLDGKVADYCLTLVTSKKKWKPLCLKLDPLPLCLTVLSSLPVHLNAFTMY